MYAKINPFPVRSWQISLSHSQLMPCSRKSQICISIIFGATIISYTLLLGDTLYWKQRVTDQKCSSLFLASHQGEKNAIQSNIGWKIRCSLGCQNFNPTRDFFRIDLFGFLPCCPSDCINLHTFHQDCE